MAKKVKHSMFVQVRDFNGDYHRKLRECSKILESDLGEAPDMSQTARVVAQRFPAMSEEIERLKAEIEKLSESLSYWQGAAIHSASANESN